MFQGLFAFIVPYEQQKQVTIISKECHTYNILYICYTYVHEIKIEVMEHCTVKHVNTTKDLLFS